MSRFNLVGFFKLLYILYTLIKLPGICLNLNALRFESKQFVKNHKFWLKITFLLKKGWFRTCRILPQPSRCAHMKELPFLRIISKNWLDIGWYTAVPPFWKFSFFQKIFFSIFSQNQYSRIYSAIMRSLWGHIGSVEDIKGHK